MKGAFGMDVEAYRNFKNLYKTGESLRDHMTDLELALTALGETVAVELHREHASSGYEQLEADAAATGEVVARTRQEIEARTGRPVVQSGNHRDWGRAGGAGRSSGPGPWRGRCQVQRTERAARTTTRSGRPTSGRGCRTSRSPDGGFGL